MELRPRPILQCGRRLAVDPVQPFCGENGLRDFIRHAHYHYYRDVVCGNQSYEQYVVVFINGHKYHDDKNAKNKNEHSKNHGIVAHLLINHRTLIEIVFSNEFELDYMSIQASIFPGNETTMYKALPSSEPIEVEELPSFNHTVSLKMLEAIVECANSIKVFKGGITMETLMSLLDGRVSAPLKVTNNRSLAYLFKALEECGVICSEWQKVIDKRELIRSRNGRLLKNGDLSTALCNASCSDNKATYIKVIDELAAKIKNLKGE